MPYSLTFTPNPPNSSNVKAPFCWKLAESIRSSDNTCYSVSLEKNFKSTVEEISYEDLPTIYKIILFIKKNFYIILIGILIVPISNLIAKKVSDKYRKKYKIDLAILKLNNLKEQRKIEELKKIEERKKIEELKKIQELKRRKLEERKKLEEQKEIEKNLIEKTFESLKHKIYKKYNADNLETVFFTDDELNAAIITWIEKNKNIKILDFSGISLEDQINKISFKAFSNFLALFPKAKTLDLTNTGIQYFDFSNLKNLKVNLSNNDIKEFNKENFPLGNAENIKIILYESPFFENKELGRSVIRTEKTYFSSVEKIIKNMGKENFKNCKNVKISVLIYKTLRMLALNKNNSDANLLLNKHFNDKNQKNNVTFEITTERLDLMKTRKVFRHINEKKKSVP
jgi:hypothetical protein